MARSELAGPPLPMSLVDQWNVYLNAWSSGRRREALVLAESLVEAVQKLDGISIHRFAHWLCERIFDDSDAWLGQFGGGLGDDNQRPVAFALTTQPLTSRIVVPFVLGQWRQPHDEPVLRWLYQIFQGSVGDRQLPAIRQRLDESLIAICGEGSEPLDVLRRAATHDDRARQWLSEIVPGDPSRAHHLGGWPGDSAHTRHGGQPPATKDIITLVDDLEAGTISRESASQWSVDHPLDDDDQDPLRRETMELLFMIDARHDADDGVPTEKGYLFGLSDLLAARDSLRHRLST